MKWIDFLVGTATGILSGCGIGGGSLLVLYLTGMVHLPQYTAGGINLLYFIGCAPTALAGHIRQRRVVWDAVLWCTAIGIAVAIPVSLLIGQQHSALLRRGFGLLSLYVGYKEVTYRKTS